MAFLFKIFTAKQIFIHNHKSIWFFLTSLFLFIFLLSTIQQLDVTKIVSDLRQVGGFLRVLQFSQPIKLTTTI
jgi:hypothetical protein